jgi:CheY-like chemotaxis protein
LVFTDIIMPGGLDGYALAEQVHTRYPGVRVLFTSGYAEPASGESEAPQARDWLHKPYAARELLGLIGEVLSRSD